MKYHRYLGRAIILIYPIMLMSHGVTQGCHWDCHTNGTLTHWGRVTHICVGNLTITGSDNGLSPGRRQAITWANVGILLIGPLGTNFREMLIEIYTFSFKKIHLKMSSGKWQPFCLGLNVLTLLGLLRHTCVGEQGKIIACTKPLSRLKNWLIVTTTVVE